MRYSFRTLLILLAVGPPVLAAIWWIRPLVALPQSASGVLSLVALIYGVSISLTLWLHSRRTGRSKQPPKHRIS